MSDARHTPSGDSSFATSLTRHVIAGLALIAVVAASFWVIGQIRPASQGTPVISAPTPSDPEIPAETRTEVSETPTDPSTPATAPFATPSVTVSPAASPSPTATSADARSSISVQVLDATGGDGDALDAAVEDLRELGYQVVASSRAVRTYDRSTLFFTDGHRGDAVQIQQDLPEFGVIEDKPDNLSDAVDVHVIVGLDHPEA
ncbi:MAG: LytR C-terminal domain-containing protein [Actinobacteria bacterium]|nr:LytR C-terminal domain-containing protein [Actinomycetota bacterium]